MAVKIEKRDEKLYLFLSKRFIISKMLKAIGHVYRSISLLAKSRTCYGEEGPGVGYEREGPSGHLAGLVYSE